MKEMEMRPINLTSRPQTPYSNGERNFMPEPGRADQSEQIDQKPATEKPQKNRPDEQVNEGEGNARFEKVAKFAETAQESISTYEQLERVHGQLGASYNEEASKIREKFVIKSNSLQQKLYEEEQKTGVKSSQTAIDAARNALTHEIRNEMDALRRDRDKAVEVLVQKFGTPKRGLTADQQTLMTTIDSIENSIENIKKSEKEGKVNRETASFQIREMQRELRNNVLTLTRPISPENEPLHDEILITIGKDRFATEEFLDRLIRLTQENAPYRLPGFYSDINLNKFLKLNESTMQKEDRERLLNLVRATETLHEMNRILKTSVDQFAQVAQTILPEHLTTIFKIPGVQDVYSLYEGIIKEKEGLKEMITDTTFREIDDCVVKEFLEGTKEKDANGEYITKSYNGEGEMEAWEKQRAVDYARNLIRTLLREGEQISLSHIPKGSKTWISLGQTQLLGVFNPVTYTTDRFKPGESNGGIELIDEVRKRGLEKRRHGRSHDQSKGIVRIEELQGTRVMDRESTKIVNARGLMMTWRATEATLRELAFIENGRVTNVAQFLEDHAREINILNEISSNNAWKSEFKKAEGRVGGASYESVEAWRDAKIIHVFRPLFENSAVAYGVLSTSIPLGATLPYEAKKMLWEKTADLNPDVMASFLTRLKLDEKADGVENIKSVKSLEQILLDVYGSDEQRRHLLSKDGKWMLPLIKAEKDRLQEDFSKIEAKLQNAREGQKSKIRQEWETVRVALDAKTTELNQINASIESLLKGEGWENLRGKLRLINRMRMRDEAARVKKIQELKPGSLVTEIPLAKTNLFEYVRDDNLQSQDEVINEKNAKKVAMDMKERVVLQAISQNGKMISQDLTNMQQAFIWYMDDVPTSVVKWENLGQAFNRMINDFGQFSQSANELTGFLYDPFKIPMEKAMEHQAKAINAAGQVLGLETAQDNFNDTVSVYDEWCMEDPQYRQTFVSAFRSAFDKYSSKAQRLARDSGAPSLNEENAYAHLLHANHMNIVRKEKRDKNGKVIFKDLFNKAKKELGLGFYNRIIWPGVRDYGIFFLFGLIMQGFKAISAPSKS
jgi:hypothetical protein